jgi:hypothetical protein
MWRRARRVMKAAAPLAFGSATLCTAASPPVPLDAPLTTTFPLGLTGPGTTHKYYTTALDMSAPLLNRGSGDFMEAARLDACERLGLQSVKLSTEESLRVEVSVREHLFNASRKCAAFLRSGVVHDREEITAALVEGVFKSEGELALLLGGKSVGKSQLLAGLARRTDIVGSDGKVRAVLYVDARQFNKNLAAGLQAALLGESKELESGWWRAWQGVEELGRRRPQGSRPEAVVSSPISSASLAAILRSIGLKAKVNFVPKASVMEANVEMLSRVVALAEERGLYICLVVDEANLAFPTPQHHAPLPPEEQRMLSDAQLLLERLVQLTKQSRRMNTLLVSSEHAYPYRLQHGSSFNTTNLTAVLFAGEVPPAEMRTLLQGNWGLGPRLSDVFLGFYGGHVHMASRALARLKDHGDQFKCESVGPVGVAGAIAKLCLGTGDKNSSSGSDMNKMLSSLAQQGFAPVLQEGDACAETLSQANIGGLVTTSNTVVGLPESLRKGAKFGCVPSSNYTVSPLSGTINLPSICPYSCLPLSFSRNIHQITPPHTFYRPTTTRSAAPHDC